MTTFYQLDGSITSAATDNPRYGRRRIDRMLAEWNAHRAAVASGDIERIQTTFDACEEWIDFAFGASTTAKSPGPGNDFG